MTTLKTSKTANAISGKTARACESCLKSRARWFCPADDAFLCQACDSAVHSANELAARHNRVRLQTASLKPTVQLHHRDDNNDDDIITQAEDKSTSSHMPAWHQGFTKKARTPRHGKRAQAAAMMMPVVPEMSCDEGSVEEEGEECEAQMVFSVPTFNPSFDVPCCDDELFNISLIGFQGEEMNHDWDNLPESGVGFEKDLVEFAADVESLLEQQETDEELHSIVPSYFITSRETDSERLVNNFLKNEGMMVKVEDEDGLESCDQFNWAMDLENEVMNFEVNNGEEEDDEEEEKKVVVGREIEVIESEILLGNLDQIEEENSKRKIFLRLNYEEIINAWDGSSPWTNGCRPELDLNHDYWPNYMGGMNVHNNQGGGGRRDLNGGDDGRQARVSRYREKRRTRLFSKKIRYEVRKLNAEKRPRLKGRFVKRTSLSSAPSPLPCMNK